MRSAAASRGIRKGVRDFLQAIAAVAAAGGTTALVELVAGKASPELAVVLTFGFKIFFAFLQNWAETAGKIPVVLPTPGLVVPVAADVTGDAAATVEAVVEETGDVVGDVVDTAGTVVGEVTGMIEPVDDVVEPVSDVVGEVTGTVGDMLGAKAEKRRRAQRRQEDPPAEG